MLNLCSWSVLNIQFRIWTSTCANSGMISVYQIWLLLNFAALKWFRCFLNCACRQVLLYAQVRIQRWENKPGAAIVTSQWSWCDLLFVLLSLTFLPGSILYGGTLLQPSIQPYIPLTTLIDLFVLHPGMLWSLVSTLSIFVTMAGFSFDNVFCKACVPWLVFIPWIQFQFLTLLTEVTFLLVTSGNRHSDMKRFL